MAIGWKNSSSRPEGRRGFAEQPMWFGARWLLRQGLSHYYGRHLG